MLFFLPNNRSRFLCQMKPSLVQLKWHWWQQFQVLAFGWMQCSIALGTHKSGVFLERQTCCFFLCVIGWRVTCAFSQLDRASTGASAISCQHLPHHLPNTHCLWPNLLHLPSPLMFSIDISVRQHKEDTSNWVCIEVPLTVCMIWKMRKKLVLPLVRTVARVGPRLDFTWV